MDPFRISVVEDILRITGRSVCVLPGLPKEPLPNTIRVGDVVELRRPDGTFLRTEIGGIAHARTLKGASEWPLRFPEPITEADIPIGTEIWWISSEKRSV
jgi:hypothetical protein